MKIGIPLETAEGERRVAATPDTMAKHKKLGFDVMVSAGAGARATYEDARYEEVWCLPASATLHPVRAGARAGTSGKARNLSYVCDEKCGEILKSLRQFSTYSWQGQGTEYFFISFRHIPGKKVRLVRNGRCNSSS